MKIFKCNQYEIAINETETSKYFDETEIVKNQQYRNFEKYVDEKMTDEERQLFASLCIDPKKFNIKSAAYFKKDDWCTVIRTSVIGELVTYPQTAFKTIEDVMENGIEALENVEANDISVGHFKIHIFTPDESDLVSDDNKNAIDIDVFISGLPWLLDEKCNHRSPKYPSGFSRYLLEHHHELVIPFLKFRYFIHNLFRKNKRRKQLKHLLSVEFENLKDRLSIDCTVLNSNDVLEYKKQWVKSFLPTGADDKLKKKAYDLCVKNKKCSTFLWHMFSFDIIQSEENPTVKFNSINKNNCTLLFETDLKDIAIKMTNAEEISDGDIVEFCKNVAGWSDFVITADDFNWTYSRTHEDGWCGPYFYKKQM